MRWQILTWSSVNTHRNFPSLGKYINLLNKASSIFASETLWAFAYLGYEERFFIRDDTKWAFLIELKVTMVDVHLNPKFHFIPQTLSQRVRVKQIRVSVISDEGIFQGNINAWDGLSKNIKEPKLNIQLVSTYLFYISNTS